MLGKYPSKAPLIIEPAPKSHITLLQQEWCIQTFDMFASGLKGVSVRTSDLGIQSGRQVCSYRGSEHSTAADKKCRCCVNHSMRQVGVAGCQRSAHNSHQGSP